MSDSVQANTLTRRGNRWISARMPWVEHFRFTRPWPRRLLYRNGALELGVVQVPPPAVLAYPWRFRAVKLNQAQDALDICSARTRVDLERMLFSDGFCLPSGSDSPERKVIERLVHEGYVESARMKVNSKTGLRS